MPGLFIVCLRHRYNKSSAVAEMAPHNVAQFEFSLLSGINSFSVISGNITNYIPWATLLYRQYGSNFNHYGVMGPKATECSEITPNNGQYAVQGHSRCHFRYQSKARMRVSARLCVPYGDMRVSCRHMRCGHAQYRALLSLCKVTEGQ